MIRILTDIQSEFQITCAEAGLVVIESRHDEDRIFSDLTFIDATDDFKVFKTKKKPEHNCSFQVNYMDLCEYLPSGHRTLRGDLIRTYMFGGDDTLF